MLLGRDVLDKGNGIYAGTIPLTIFPAQLKFGKNFILL